MTCPTERPATIVGDLSINTSDGTILTAPNDLLLAWAWAEHENGEGWGALTHREQYADVSAALAELRRAYKGTALYVPLDR